MKRGLFLLLLPLVTIAMDAYKYPLRATKARQQRNKQQSSSPKKSISEGLKTKKAVHYRDKNEREDRCCHYAKVNVIVMTTMLAVIVFTDYRDCCLNNVCDPRHGSGRYFCNKTVPL